MPINNDGKYLEELWIGIKADYASLQKGLKISQNEIQSFVGHIATSSAQLKKFGRTTTLISGAVAAMGIMINSVFAKFEQSMANTVSVLGGTEKEMKQLSATARKMGETTIFSASQAADAMYYLASAGYDANQVMGALKGTLDLAAATQFDLAETTRIVVSAINSFGLTASDAVKVSNVFSAIISSSQATMGRLGESMKFVAPIAAGLGISIEQTSAALGVLYNSGLTASLAGTALRTGLIRLQAPTEAAQKAIKKLGISYDDINPQMHSLVEIMKAFKKAGAGMIDKGDELAKIFGARTVAAWQILIKAGAKEMANLEEKITGTNKAAEMAKIQINTFSGQMKLLKSVMQEAAIQIGEALQPILRSFVDLLKDAFALFNNLPKSLKTALATITALAAGFGLIVGPVALLLAQLPSLIAMFTGLGVSMSVALGWVGAISIAIVALTSLLGGYVRKQAELGAATKAINNQTQQAQGEFDLLARRYLELKKNVHKTKTEKELYLKTIKDLQEKYPNYLKNINLEKIGYNDAKTAIEQAGISLKKYLDLQVLQAELTDKNSKYIEIGKKIGKIQSDLTDAQFNLTDAQKKYIDAKKKYNEEASKTIAGGFDDSDVFVASQAANKIKDQVDNLTSSLKSLKIEQDTIFKDIKKKQAQIHIQTPLTPKPKKSKSSGAQDCPAGYHWDVGKKMCVPNKVKTKTDEQAVTRAQQLEQELLNIKEKGLQTQLSALAQNKDKSLAEGQKYLTAVQSLEKIKLKNWFDSEQKRLKNLGATTDQMKKLEKTYNDNIIALDKKQFDERKALNKKWSDEQKADAERKLGNQMKYNLDSIKKQNELTGGTGYSDEYGVQLEAYQKYLQDKLSAAKVWNDEYTYTLNQLSDVQDEIYNNDLEKARVFFFSLKDAADLATAGIGGGFEKMWSMYIMPKSRKAKNDLDAIWMAMKNSFLSMLGDMVKKWIENAVMQAIFSKTMQATQIAGALATGSAMAAAYAPAATLASIMSFGGASAAGIAALSAAMATGQTLAQIPVAVPGAATGAVVKKSGTLQVHPDEVIVPANIVRANKKQYENAAGTTNNTENTTDVNNYISFVLNNPVVDDERYWQDVHEKYLIPTIEKYSKRMQ